MTDADYVVDLNAGDFAEVAIAIVASFVHHLVDLGDDLAITWS